MFWRLLYGGGGVSGLTGRGGGVVRAEEAMLRWEMPMTDVVANGASSHKKPWASQ